MDSVPFSDAAAAFAIVLTLFWAGVAAALWASFIRHSRRAAASAPPARRAGLPGSAGILPAELGNAASGRASSILGGATTTTRQWVDVATAPSPSPDNEALSPHPVSAVWTTTATFTTYLPDGRRVETAVTTASDASAVTNSVSTYDLLGRLLSTATPGANGATIATAYAYDGASSRVISVLTTGSPTVTYGYNERGERVRTSQDGKAILTDTYYETIDQQVYRVNTAKLYADGSRIAYSHTDTAGRRARLGRGEHGGNTPTAPTILSAARSTRAWLRHRSPILTSILTKWNPQRSPTAPHTHTGTMIGCFARMKR